MKHKKILIGLIIIILSFLSFKMPASALSCSSGICYCTEDGSECGLYRNPRGDKTVVSDKTKCGCEETTTEEGGSTNPETLDFCLDTSSIWQFIGYILLALKTVIPLVIIILGIIDLAKAVISNDDKATTKAVSSVVKRLIMGVAIFFIPTLLSLVFSLIKTAAPVLASAEECQVCLLRPTSTDCDNYKKTAAKNREERDKNATVDAPTYDFGDNSGGNSTTNDNTNTVEISMGNVKSISLSSLSCDVYYNGGKLESLNMNETISSKLTTALSEICTFLKSNGSKYNLNRIDTAGTYNTSANPKYPHAYAMGIDLFNNWSYTYNGKTYTPYKNYGPSSYTTYNNFICEVCDGKENCEANLNYQIYEKIFKPLGFCWGGNWKSQYHDPMHFEYSRLNNGGCSVNSKSFNC